jgi:hypothetical protein
MRRVIVTSESKGDMFQCVGGKVEQQGSAPGHHTDDGGEKKEAETRAADQGLPAGFGFQTCREGEAHGINLSAIAYLLPLYEEVMVAMDITCWTNMPDVPLIKQEGA